jgi:hypothetical protein
VVRITHSETPLLVWLRTTLASTQPTGVTTPAKRTTALAARRWIELVGSAAIAGSIAVVAAPAIVGRLKPFYDRWWPAHPWLAWPALVIAIGIMIPFGRNRWLAFLGLRHFARYPPLWVAGLLGFCFCSLYWSFVPAAWQAAGGGLHDAADLRFLGLGAAGLILIVHCMTWAVVVDGPPKPLKFGHGAGAEGQAAARTGTEGKRPGVSAPSLRIDRA